MAGICPRGMATVPMLRMSLEGSKASPWFSELPGSQLGDNRGPASGASFTIAKDWIMVGGL